VRAVVDASGVGGDFPLAFSPEEKGFSRLLRHRSVQVLLASDMLVHWLCDVGDTKALDGKWPVELVTETALGLRQRMGWSRFGECAGGK